jgi:GTPase involved in cell partitioning and DNA repair
MKLLGSPGADIDIKAPVGVTVLSDDGDVLGDLTEKGQTVTVAQGLLIFIYMLGNNSLPVHFSVITGIGALQVPWEIFNKL